MTPFGIVAALANVVTIAVTKASPREAATRKVCFHPFPHEPSDRYGAIK